MYKNCICTMYIYGQLYSLFMGHMWIFIYAPAGCPRYGNIYIGVYYIMFYYTILYYSIPYHIMLHYGSPMAAACNKKTNGGRSSLWKAVFPRIAFSFVLESGHLFVCSFACLLVRLLVCICLFVCLFVCWCVCAFVLLFLCLIVCLFVCLCGHRQT